MTDEQLLGALGNECTRRILVAGATQPVTVEELVDHCNVSASTVYRRLRTLEELGLVRSDTDIQSDGGTKSVYVTDVERIELLITDDGLDLSLDTEEPTGQRAVKLLREIEFEQADIDFERGTLDLRMEFDSSLLDQFVEIWELVSDDDETA